MKYKTLQAFTLAVNNLARKDCDNINKTPKMFKAQHIDFPVSMLDRYMKDGYTPRQVLKQLDADAKWENHCEARCS